MGASKLEKYLTRQFEKLVSRDSVEREQKYRVDGLDPIRKRLVKLGAEVHASGFERNELFDCNDRLRRQGLKLRLRCHGGKIAMLTLKGPRQDGRQKARMEVETRVDYQAAKRILELLDFRVKETYSKRREEYRLDGCAVCLDDIPNAGCFVEIEGAPRKISTTARRIGLRPADRERRSYRKLIKDASVPSRSGVRSNNGTSRK